MKDEMNLINYYGELCIVMGFVSCVRGKSSTYLYRNNNNNNKKYWDSPYISCNEWDADVRKMSFAPRTLWTTAKRGKEGVMFCVCACSNEYSKYRFARAFSSLQSPICDVYLVTCKDGIGHEKRMGRSFSSQQFTSIRI